MPSLRPGTKFLAERYGPVVLSIIAGLVISRVPSLWLLGASWRELLVDKMLDVEIGLLAGLIAVVAFLPAIEDKTVIRKFKQWGYYKYLVGYLKESIWISGCAMVLTLVLIVYSDAWKSHYRVNQITSACWWGLVLYSFATAFRIVKLALKSLLAKEDRRIL